LKIDLHTHTARYSGCSRIKPEELVSEAAAAGLDAVLVTEHNVSWEDKDLAALSTADVQVFGGVEITTLEGDCLVLAPELQGLPVHSTVEELVGTVHERGGLVFLAHPFRTTLERNRRSFESSIDGLELQSCNNFGRLEREAAQEVAAAGGLMLISGSDAHTRDMVGCFYLELGRSVHGVAGLVEVLREGAYRCRRDDERFYEYFDARSARFRALVSSEVLGGCRELEALKRSTGLSSDVIRSVLAGAARASST